MKHTFISISIAVFYLALGLSQAFADEAMELQMFVEEEIETIDANGNRSLKRIAPENVIPGDTVVYSTRYENKGEQPANNVIITNIIPEEVTYLSGSATGSLTITYSTDGGKHYDQEENLSIIKDGKSRPATAKDYTHIRWLLPLVDSGKTGQVSFLSKVNED